MPITFPRPFPLTRFQESTVVLQRRQMSGDTEGGDDVVIERGQPAWLGTWTTNTLSDADARTWDAWLASLKGGINHFLGFDTERAWPAAYTPSGTGMPGTATGTLAAIGGANDLATIHNLGAGLTLRAGDHVSLIQGGSRYSLHTVLDAQVTFDGTGVGVVQLDPAIPAFVTTAAAVNIVQACAKFRLLKRDGITFSGDQGPRPGKPLTILGISTYR